MRVCIRGMTIAVRVYYTRSNTNGPDSSMFLHWYASETAFPSVNTVWPYAWATNEWKRIEHLSVLLQISIVADTLYAGPV